MPDLPAWALGTFAPSDSEKTDISIYVVPDEASVMELAAAWSATLEKAAASVWAMLDERDATAAGLRWAVDGLGTTASPKVNGWHAALEIPSASMLEASVRAFASGGLHSCEKRTTEAELERSVRANSILLVAPEKGRADRNPFKKVPYWAAEGWVSISGIARS